MGPRELELIKELMEELQGKMKYTPEDFDGRLGKKKPGIEVIKIEGMSEESPELEEAEESLGMDLDDDQEMGESEEHREAVLGEDEDEGSSLKKRLMRLRG